MAEYKKFTEFVFIVWILATTASASTHWVVTEDGKIQEQVYSIFNMRRPYDLVALMQQEMRAEMAENFMDQLDGQIMDIDSKRNKAINLQDKFYATEKDCVLAEKPLTDYNLFVSTIATCQELNNSLQELCQNLQPVQSIQEPNCTRLHPLDFSMHAFEHLQAMRERKNLSMLPEVGLVGILPNVIDISAFGHAVNRALQQNKTSWVLYNFAGYYFRFIGDGYRAIECIRRALHFSPPELKHIALLNLGNVLHLSQRSDAAAVVVLAALDIDAINPVLHFTLGNIYAVMAEYNKSIEAFNAVLLMNPDFEAAAQRRHAVLCHSKLEKALEAQYNSLKKIMVDLGNFEIRLDFWQKQQFKLLEEQAPLDVRFSSEMDYTQWKILQNIQGETRASSAGQKSTGSCSKISVNGQPSLGCAGGQPVVTNIKFHLDSSFTFLIKQAEMKTAMLKDELLAKQNERISILNKYLIQNDNEKQTAETTATASTTLTEMTATNLPPAGCEQEDMDMELLVSMPIFFFHKRDIGLGGILAEIADDTANDLVPLCHADYNSIFDNLWNWIFSNIKLDDNLIAVARGSMQKYIMSCCGAITVEEFGHRIAIAIERELAPKWLLYHVAATYWGATGDVKHLSECLMHSKAMSPPEYKHITVVPFASLLGSTGLHLAAINFIKYSIDENEYQPETMMLLADLYVMAMEYDKAFMQYKKILAEDPENQGILKRIRSVSCYLQKTRGVAQQKENEDRMTLKAEQEQPLWIDLEDEESDGHCHSSNNRDFQDDCTVHKLVADEDSHELPQGKPGNGDSKTIPPSQQHMSTTPSLNQETQQIPLKLPRGQGVEASPPAVETTTESAEKQVVEDDPLPDILLQVQEPPKASALAPVLCDHLPPTDFKHFTSTWLSVSAKGIVVSKLLDTRSAVKESPVQPFCNSDHLSSALTLDHLSGIKHRSNLVYTPETGLREAFQTLGREGEGPESVEMMGTRLAQALQQNSTSWVLSTLAALYWRVTGQAEQAIDCLRQALHFAPRNMKDIPLISLANILHRANLYNDALIVANMALEISPSFVVIHFTLANIFAAKGNLEQARAFYESTLTLQPSFEPARDKLRAIYCNSVSDEYKNNLNNGIE